MKKLTLLVIAISTFLMSFINPIKERVALLDTIIDVLHQHIANPKWMKSTEFIAFKEAVYSAAKSDISEAEFKRVFDQERQKLPFTHFYLQDKNGVVAGKTLVRETPIEWKELNRKTAYLDVNSFVVSAQPMIEAISEIGIDRYENLIIDLRGNTGGSLDAPVVLGRFLTPKLIDGGVYLTRKWYEAGNGKPSQAEINNFPFLQDFTFTTISKMFQEESGFRMVIPPHNQPTFQGNVYVLIDRYTGSACEPLIDLFKKENIAVLVGETSAGSMLSGKSFELNDSFNVFIPIADYYTASGDKIDKIGVRPTIEVNPNDALNHVLTELID